MRICSPPIQWASQQPIAFLATYQRPYTGYAFAALQEPADEATQPDVRTFIQRLPSHDLYIAWAGGQIKETSASEIVASLDCSSSCAITH